MKLWRGKNKRIEVKEWRERKTFPLSQRMKERERGLARRRICIYE